MFARVTSTSAPPEGAIRGINYLRETVHPLLRRQAGYKGTYYLLNRETGKALTIDLWGTNEDIGRSEALYNQISAQARKDYNLPEDHPFVIDLYEVALTP